VRFGDVTGASWTTAAELYRRHARRATAVAITMLLSTTTGQNVAWRIQIRRWTFTTRFRACRSRTKLSMPAFRHDPVPCIRGFDRGTRTACTQVSVSKTHDAKRMNASRPAESMAA
jgi:hypothetical protein